MKRVLVSGYYGFGNAGDEAILAALVEGLTGLVPEVRISVLSGSPAETAALHGVEAIGRMDVVRIARAVATSDLVVSGGGSLLQDVTSQRNIPYYLGVVALARMLRRPVMLYAQGVGPVTRRPGRWLIPRVLNGVRHVTVRDAESLALLRELGVVRPPAEVTADASLALEPAPGFDARAALLAEGIDPERRPIIGLALRAWHEGAGAAGLAEVADALAAETGGQVLFLPMQLPDDVALSRAVLARMARPGGVLLARRRHPREMLALISALDLVVGMRLHALIFAAAVGVPVLGLSYDPKIDSFLRTLEWDSGLTLQEAIAGEVAARARAALERRPELVAHLARRVPPLRESARRNNVLAAELLRTPSLHAMTSRED